MDPLVKMVNVEVALVGFVLKTPSAPDGRPLTVRATDPLNPPVETRFIAYVVDVPCRIV